jgi:tetratricopeptide (TPR) repeat protein
LDYANCLSSIGFLKNKLGFSSDAIPYHVKSIEIFRVGERNGLPDWDKFFFYGLKNYAMCRESLSELSYAVDILQEAASICKRHYSLSERQWGSYLVDCLRAQAEILKKMGRFSDAIEVSEEADMVLI